MSLCCLTSRINPFKTVSLEELKAQLRAENGGEVELKEVEWLSGFYQLPGCTKIASLESYKSGWYKPSSSSDVPRKYLWNRRKQWSCCEGSGTSAWGQYPRFVLCSWGKTLHDLGCNGQDWHRNWCRC